MKPKQARFVAEFLKDQDATKAARRSGYSAKTARVQGPRLLKDPAIRAAIDEKLGAITENCELTAERILKRIQKIAFSELAEDKNVLKACELLGKYMKLFTDRIQVDTPGRVLIELPPNGRESPLREEGNGP